MLAVVVFACAQPAFAQQGFSGAAYTAYPSGFGGGYSPVSPMLPMGTEPWPRISPYQHAFSQHANQNGLWFHKTMNSGGQGPRPFLQLDYLNTTTRSQKGLIGNPNAISYYQQHFDNIVEGFGQALADSLSFQNYFDALDASDIGEMDGHGIRARTGFWFASGSGLLAEFTWQDEASTVYDARKRDLLRANFNENRLDGQVGGTFQSTPFGPIVFDPDSPAPFNNLTQKEFVLDLLDRNFPLLSEPPIQTIDFVDGETDEIFFAELRNLRGIPVADGSFGGVTLPFDIDYIVRTTSENLGSNVNFATNPLYESSSLTVRAVFGGRYMYLREGLYFRGIDSGFIYDEGDLDPDFKLVAINDGVDDDGNGFIDNAGEPTAGVITAAPISQGPADGFGTTVRAFLDSEATSHLAGPEVGVQYEVGKAGSLRVTGHTKVALLFNREEVEIRGDNIGLGTRTDLLGNPGVLFERTIANPNPNTFSDADDVTHLSPLFEQSITAELPIFRKIPFFKRHRQFENAVLRAGFTFIAADEIASPNQSVLWQGNPQAGLFPEVDIQRDSWWTFNWNLGVEWPY